MNLPRCNRHGPAEWRRDDETLRLTVFCGECDRLEEANELRALWRLAPLEALPEKPPVVPEEWQSFLLLSDEQLQRLYDAHGLHTLATALGVCWQRVKRHLVSHGIAMRHVGNPAAAKRAAISYDLFATFAA